MNKGFVILAENNKTTNYVKCAELLAYSLKKCMPDANITLVTSEKSNSSNIDKIVPLPYGDISTDEWKLVNDWQVYEASPYEYTIKLEADMYVPSSIEHWWDILSVRDLAICTTIRNFKGEISNNRVYRKFIDDNNLPDTYNAITYFKKSDTAKTFFDIVRSIFTDWDEFKQIVKCNPDEKATTDFVYALAVHIMGIENCVIPNFTDMSMVHMKQFINGLPTENWTDTLIYEVHPETLRINTVPQRYPFHYNVKSFSDKIEKEIATWKKTKIL